MIFKPSRFVSVSCCVTSDNGQCGRWTEIRPLEKPGVLGPPAPFLLESWLVLFFADFFKFVIGSL